MDYYIHIQSEFDGILHTCQKEFNIEKDKTKSFLLNTDKEKISLSFFPLDDKMGDYLPFSTMLNLGSKQCDSKNVQVIEYPNKNILLVVKTFRLKYPKQLNIKSKVLTFGGTEHTLYYTKNGYFSLHIEDGKKQCLDAEFDNKVYDLSTKFCDSHLVVFGETFDKKYIICHITYDGKYQIVGLEQVDLLESDKNILYTYKDLQDNCHHGKTKEYSFDNSFSIKENLVYNENEPFYVKQKEYVPYAFCDAILQKNYNLARTYLSNELASKLDDNHIKAFFGDFISTHPSLNNSKDDISLIYKNHNKFFAKTFHLTFDNENKIINILFDD